MATEKAVGWLVVSAFLLAARADGGAAAPKDLEEFLRLAEAGNASVKAARARWMGARLEPRMARAFPDPVLGLGIMPSDMRIHTARGPMSRRYSAEQKIPFPGKRFLAGRQARERAAQAEAAYHAVRLDVRARTAAVCARLYFIEKSIAATQEQQELLSRFVLVAERKYATGRHPQSDVFRAQVEQAKLENMIITLRGDEVTARARLNALLGRRLDEPVDRPVLEKAPFDFAASELERMAMECNSELLGRRAEVHALLAARKAATLGYFPDFVLGYEYTSIDSDETMPALDGTDAQTFVFKLELPLWFRSNSAANRRARFLLDAARAEEEDASRRVKAETVALAVEARTHLRLAELFENTLIPLAEGTLASTQKGYEADRAEFLEVLDSHRSLLDIKLEYHQHLSEYWTVRTKLESMVGGRLEPTRGGE